MFLPTSRSRSSRQDLKLALLAVGFGLLVSLTAQGDTVSLTPQQQAECKMLQLTTSDSDKWSDVDKICILYLVERRREDSLTTGAALSQAQKDECSRHAWTPTPSAWTDKEWRCAEYVLTEKPQEEVDKLAAGDKEECKKKVLSSKRPTDWKPDDRACVKRWLDEETKIDESTSVKFTFGSSGDESKALGEEQTDAEKLYKVDLGFVFSRGSYPLQFGFYSGASLRFEEGELEEEVSMLSAFLDRYLAPAFPRVEGWVFADRTTDSFLQIEERYEIGVGVDLEYWFGPVRMPVFCPEDLQAKPRRPQRIETLQKEHWAAGGRAFRFSRSSSDGPRTSPRERMQAMEALARAYPKSEFARSYCKSFHGIVERQTEWMVSLGLSIFSEFEQAEELELFLDRVETVDGEETIVPAEEAMKVALDAEQRFRWAVRPSIRYRPTESLSFLARVYFKFPFDDPHRVDGRRDQRTDGEFQLKYDVREPDKASIVLRYEYAYDPAPPSIPQERLDALIGDAEDVRPRGATANSRHWKIKLGFQFSL